MDVRLIILDEHPTVQESLRFLFSRAGMEQIQEATSLQEIVDAIRHQTVDLVLLDVAMQGGHGLEILRQIKSASRSLPVLVHSLRDTDRLLTQCFEAGACGYIVKGRDKNQLLDAIRRAAGGETVWTQSQTARIRESIDQATEANSAATPTMQTA